jgi:hypothetical protein
MQLTTYELVLNLFIAVVMPLLILANLRDWGMKSPMNVYLWREAPNLMRVSLVILGLLAVWSVIRLGGHFGLLPADLVDTALLVVGVPFLIAAVAEIWLVAKAARQYLRAPAS